MTNVALLDFPGSGAEPHTRSAVGRLGGRLLVLSSQNEISEAEPIEIVLNLAGWNLDSDLLDRLPSCRAIVGYGVGADWIDTSEATKRGIVVTNTPDVNSDEVAVHSLALMLACERKIKSFDLQVQQGGFDPFGEGHLHRMRGRTVGLLAFGRAARRFRELLRPLGVHVIAHDPAVPTDLLEEHDVESVSLDELLVRAEILSVHAPLTDETNGLLNEERLGRLPRGCILVVTSRGAIYDADCVARLVRTGNIAAAGLDVFPTEPLSPGSSLRNHPRIILTPHAAGYTEEATADTHATALAALADVFAGTLPSCALNPEAWNE